jgi:dienelactone hydrolase
VAIELAARFGREDHLVGVVSVPSSYTMVSTTGIIILNAGLVYRIGPNRLHVRLGREFASRGFPSLRMDLSGIGDSATAMQPQTLPEVADIQDAIDYLARTQSIRQVVLFGICAGAVNSYRCALKESRVRGVVLVDGYLYRTWKTLPKHYLRRLQEESHWFALALSKIGSIIKGSRKAASPQPILTMDTGSLPKAEYAAGLRQLDMAGQFVLQVMSGDFPELYNYASQYRDGFKRFGLSKNIRAHYFPGADHAFTSKQQQKRLLDYTASTVSDLCTN